MPSVSLAQAQAPVVPEATLRLPSPRESFPPRPVEGRRAPEARPASELARDLGLVESKLCAPSLRRGVVARTALVNRLRASHHRSVATILAPAGYGKTTLLSQWAQRDRRRIAWLSLDESDNELERFLAYVTEALARADVVDPAAAWAVVRRGAAYLPTVLARLGRMLAAAPEPAAIALDDVHMLRDRDCVSALALLVEHLSDGSVLALAGRSEPKLPLARLRAEGRLLELGTCDLTLNERETRALLRATGVDTSPTDVSALVERTEGWSAGLSLAALSLRIGGASDGFAGDHRFVTDYLRFEVLSLLPADDVRFLRRTSVLERMRGPLCDAVLGQTGSAGVLERLERSGLFLVPLDQQRRWYRYRGLFRDLLRAELDRHEPELVPVLNRKAADWCAENGLPEAAVDHAQAAGDTGRATELIGRFGPGACAQGEIWRVRQWLDTCAVDGLHERTPRIAALGAWVRSLAGDAAEAERLAEAVAHGSELPGRRRSSRTAVALAAFLRAAACRNGPEEMRSDAELATAALRPGNAWGAEALLLLAVSHHLAGDDGEAELILADVADAASAVGDRHTGSIALAQLALLAAARDDWERAEALAREARSLAASLEGYPTTAIAWTASGRIALRRGDLARAREDLARAESLLPRLTHALPWLAVETRIELARGYLALADHAGAERRASEIDVLLRRRPALGLLRVRADELVSQIEALAATGTRPASRLTAAELRLLPLLATHLSFREIATKLYVSRNTVKTQAISVYRKLGASSRSAAIERAAELGLIDSSVPAGAGELARAG